MIKIKKIPTIYLTGLSASGKTTVSNELSKVFKDNYINCQVLDGDLMRQGLNKDLGFSDNERKENIRRVCEVSKILLLSGVLPIISTISPFHTIRKDAKETIGESFVEIYVEASLDTCIMRDPKGFYKKALAGKLLNFTGIDSPYEVPLSPDLVLNTENTTVQNSVSRIIKLLEDTGYIEQKENFINHGNPYLNDNPFAYAVFVGRFQPYHFGHIKLVEQKLNKGIPVLIMVRDTPVSASNPYTNKEVVMMIEKYHESLGDNVKVISIPDIESINYGRGVGYQVNEFFLDEGVENVSATFIRNSILEGNTEWKNLVPSIIHGNIINGLEKF